MNPHSCLESKLVGVLDTQALREYQTWWETRGCALSGTVDRAGTPLIRMHNRWGERVDELIMPEGYSTLVQESYRHGAVSRVIEQNDLRNSFALGYITSFYDPGLYCPHTVSLSTAVPLHKYGSPELRERFLTPMLLRDGDAWQGATWMTEAGGGSDIGTYVRSVAVPHGDFYLLTGEKYFCSNVGAELAVVAARPMDAPEGIRGLALFLVPRYRGDGSLNYFMRRMKEKIATRSVPTGEVELKESEGYLLGSAEMGVYLILEVLNCSRVANSIGSAALAHRAISEAERFAAKRIAFGKPLIEQPLMRAQFERWKQTQDELFALAWSSVELLQNVWQQTPPYSDQYHLFRLVTHLAKYWTAEQAVQAAKWSMEVHGGQGVLSDFGIERLLREAMILAIWEGGSHRQMLDALEVLQKRRTHELLLDWMAPNSSQAELQDWRERIEQYLLQPSEDQEAQIETLMPPLAQWVGKTLQGRYTIQQ